MNDFVDMTWLELRTLWRLEEADLAHPDGPRPAEEKQRRLLALKLAEERAWAAKRYMCECQAVEGHHNPDHHNFKP